MFDELVQHLGATIDNQGWAHCTCPGCGKEAATRHGDTHFSFNDQGGHCFVCGQGWGIYQLAKEILGTPTVALPQRKARRRNEGRPTDFKERLGRLNGRSTSTYMYWQEYKPLDDTTIDKHRLCFDLLPFSACVHPRLIYPVYEEEAVVALRGRAVDCTCPKWLNSKGSKVALWGSQYLRLGAQVYIVENPVDAMLLMQEWPTKVAVAGTGGAGTWRDEWTKRILTSRPSQIWIVYDNDVAGKNGSAKVAQSFGGMGKGLGFSLFNYIWPGFSKEGADVGDMMIVQQREGGVTA